MDPCSLAPLYVKLPFMAAAFVVFSSTCSQVDFAVLSCFLSLESDAVRLCFAAIPFADVGG